MTSPTKLYLKPQIIFYMWICDQSFLTVRLMRALSHLREGKLRHNFQDSLDPLCNCSQQLLLLLNYLQHYELGLVICVNTNLDTILKTPWTHSATAVGVLKQLFTSFSTAQMA